jgi:hypothetical protein
MCPPQTSNPQWGDSYRLIASEKWKAKSAAMGRHVTDALVGNAQPQPGIQILPPEDVWDYARSVSTPFRTLLDRVPQEKWLDINREIYKSVRQYARADGIEFGAVVVLAPGIKAQR